MATIALDSPYDKAAAKPPISLHPAFPAIVALWFAALLGVGSLVLPAVLLEGAVAATGIASLVPAAAPPLGFTARAIIAVVAALAGAAVGSAIARRVAQAQSPEPESRVAKLASRSPLRVREELGGEGLVNGESLPINRRRALAISEDDRPSDFLYQAPLPGVDPEAPAPFAPVTDECIADDEPLELCELAAEDAAPAAPAAAEPDDAAEANADQDPVMTESRESPSVWPSHQHFPAPAAEPGDERDSRKNLAGPRGLEPLPFSPPSLARKPKVVFQPAPAPQPEPEVEVESESMPEPEVQLAAVAPARGADEQPEFRADWETAPLEGLGLVQLVQRLGSTLERRRERLAQPSDPVAPSAATVPSGFAEADFEPAPAEEAVQAMAAYFGSAPATTPEPDDAPAEPSFAAPAEAPDEPPAAPRPGFLRSFAIAEEDESDDDLPDFSLPLRRPVPPPAAVASLAAEPANESDELEEDAGEASEGAYSSLLGMGNPFAAPKNEFVRIEEPESDADPAEPAVVFPGQQEPAGAADSAANGGSRLFDPPGKGAGSAQPAAPAPADADAALRAALATLQRMSGAA